MGINFGRVAVNGTATLKKEKAEECHIITQARLLYKWCLVPPC
jgi:hypothetical protein